MEAEAEAETKKILKMEAEAEAVQKIGASTSLVRTEGNLLHHGTLWAKKNKRGEF